MRKRERERKKERKYLIPKCFISLTRFSFSESSNLVTKIGLGDHSQSQQSLAQSEFYLTIPDPIQITILSRLLDY